jgi:hypothetical protein
MISQVLLLSLLIRNIILWMYDLCLKTEYSLNICVLTVINESALLIISDAVLCCLNQATHSTHLVVIGYVILDLNFMLLL